MDTMIHNSFDLARMVAGILWGTPDAGDTEFTTTTG
jgi:hypothetical protein